MNTSLRSQNVLQSNTKSIRQFPVSTKDWKDNSSPDYSIHAEETSVEV